MSSFLRAFLNLFVMGLGASAHDFQWVTTFPGNSSAMNIALDAQSNSFVAGNFSGTVNFGTNQLIGGGSNDVFIAKLNPTGGVAWVTHAGGTNEFATGIALAPDGSIFVSGSFIGAATFGALSLTNNNFTEGFLARLDVNGQFLWVREVTNSVTAFLTLSPSTSRVWLACGGIPVLRAYDFAGANIFNYVISSNAGVSGLTVDSSDNVYLNGTFFSAANIGGTNLTGPGNGGLYTAKIASNGVVQWAVTLNDSHRQEGHGVALSPDGAVISFGRIDTPHQADIDPTILLLKHSANGALLWTEYYGFTKTPLTAEAVAVDTEGNPHVVGHMLEPFLFPNPRQGTPIVALIATGTVVYAARIFGPTTGNDSYGHGLAIDPNGNLYIAGHFNGTAFFGANEITASPVGADNAYVAKFGEVVHPALAVQHATNGVIVSWPTANFGFRLQQAADIPSDTWSNVFGFQNSFPTEVTNLTQVTVPTNSLRGFLRLSTP